MIFVSFQGSFFNFWFRKSPFLIGNFIFQLSIFRGFVNFQGIPIERMQVKLFILLPLGDITVESLVWESGEALSPIEQREPNPVDIPWNTGWFMTGSSSWLITIPILDWVVFHPLYTAINQGPLNTAQLAWSWKCSEELEPEKTRILHSFPWVSWSWRFISCFPVIKKLYTLR